MVIAVHTSQPFPYLPNSLAKILIQGARGVHLFFVTSALTLSMSWVARNESAADFYTRHGRRAGAVLARRQRFVGWVFWMTIGSLALNTGR